MKRLVATLRHDDLLFEYAALTAQRRPAMDFVGIDLHKTSSQICILSESGELTERRIKSTRATLWRDGTEFVTGALGHGVAETAAAA